MKPFAARPAFIVRPYHRESSKTGKHCITVIAMIVFVCCLAAQPVPAADKWISIKTQNFLIVGNGSENDIRRTGTHLEELRHAVATLFPVLDQPAAVNTVVFVFRNDDRFGPYKPVADVTGFFKPGEDLHFMAFTGQLNAQGLVLHDYVHSLLRDAAGTLPVWAAEGIAEHFSTFEMGRRESEFEVGKTPPRHVRTLNENQYIPLERLFTLDHTASELDEKTKQGAFYAEVAALMHYLTSDPKRQPQLARFLSLLSQDRSFGQSFNDAFQTDVPSLDKEVRDFLRGRTSLSPIKVNPKNNGLIDRTMEAKTLSEAQAQHLLGDLLLHIERFGDAEAHFKAALALDSGMTAANASMAMLTLRQRQAAAGVPFMKKALETGTNDYLVQYYAAYQMQLMIEDGDPVVTSLDSTPHATMRAHLLKAIDLAPHFVEAYGLLGHINLAEGENLKEADTILRKALTMAPGRHDLSLKLAEAMLRTEQIPAARGLLENLGRVTSDPAVRSRALNMIEQLEMRDSYFKELGDGTRPPDPVVSTPPPSQPEPAAPRRREQPKLEALTPLEPQVEGEKIQGLLILLDCKQGLSLRVQTDGRVIELHSATPDRIQFLSYTSGVADNIKCGPRNPGIPVRITYRRLLGGTPSSIGEPLVVEFLEQKERRF